MSDNEFPDPSNTGSFRYVCRVFEYFGEQGEVAVIEALKVRLEEQLGVAQAKLEEPIVLTDAMRRLLNERAAAFEKDPNQGTSWEEVKKEIFGRQNEDEH